MTAILCAFGIILGGLILLGVMAIVIMAKIVIEGLEKR